MDRVCMDIWNCINHQSGSSFAVAAYVTSYISKVDKFNKVGWKDLLRELDTQIKSIAVNDTGMTEAWWYK